MKVKRFHKNFRGEWESDGPAVLPNASPEVAVLLQQRFPVDAIVIEYADGTVLRYANYKDGEK